MCLRELAATYLGVVEGMATPEHLLPSEYKVSLRSPYENNKMVPGLDR